MFPPCLSLRILDFSSCESVEEPLRGIELGSQQTDDDLVQLGPTPLYCSVLCHEVSRMSISQFSGYSIAAPVFISTEQ